jgi:hypothetical protein
MISPNQLASERLMCNAIKQLATDGVHVNTHTYLESMYVPQSYKRDPSHSVREIMRNKTPSLVCGNNARRNGDNDGDDDVYSDVNECGQPIRVVDRSMPTREEVAYYRIPFERCGACACDDIAHYPFNNHSRRT